LGDAILAILLISYNMDTDGD